MTIANGLNTVPIGFEIWKTSDTNKSRNTCMYISYSNSFYSYIDSYRYCNQSLNFLNFMQAQRCFSCTDYKHGVDALGFINDTLGNILKNHPSFTNSFYIIFDLQSCTSFILKTYYAFYTRNIRKIILKSVFKWFCNPDILKNSWTYCN